jgi:hypothetical protein
LAIVFLCALLPFILSSQIVTVTTSINWVDFEAQNNLTSSTIPDSMTINIENSGELITAYTGPGSGSFL